MFRRWLEEVEGEVEPVRWRAATSWAEEEQRERLALYQVRRWRGVIGREE